MAGDPHWLLIGAVYGIADRKLARETYFVVTGKVPPPRLHQMTSDELRRIGAALAERHGVCTRDTGWCLINRMTGEINGPGDWSDDRRPESDAGAGR